MARLRYRPSTRVKQFNPPQLSQQGITELRRRSDRMIRGLESNLQAEKAQQERDRAAMRENADLSEDRIRRDREIQNENLRQEQISLSKQESVDRQQLKYDHDAQNVIFESIAGFAKTAAAKAAENHANMVKDQTELAKNANIDKEREQWNELRARRAQGAIQSDVDTIESDIENQRPLIETYKGILSNNGRGDIYNEIVLNRLVEETFDKATKDAFESTEKIYTDAQGNKFSGADALGNADLNRIVTSTEHKRLKKELGADTAVEGYLDRSEKAIEKKKQASADRANKVDEKKVLEQIEFQAQTLNSGGTAEDHLQAFNERAAAFGLAYAHEQHRKLYENPNNDRAELDRMGTFLEGGKSYSEGRWANQVAEYKRRGDENEAKAYAANKRFKRAQLDEQALQNRDQLVEAYQRNPEAFIRYIEQQENETGIKRSESIGYIIKYADVELERADRAKLQFEFTNSKITEEYINNNIKHPTVKKEAVELLKKQKEERFGPEHEGVEKGLRNLAREAAKNGGAQDISGRAILIEAFARKWLDDDVKNITGDPKASRVRLRELYLEAKKNLDNPDADTLNPFYQKTNEYNQVEYPNIENPKGDPVARRTTLFNAVKRHHADVRQYAFSVETQDETNITLESARMKGKPLFSNNLKKVVDMLNESNPDKKRITYSEFFNEMQKAKSKISGESHPILENTFGTQVMDALSPEDSRTLDKAYKLSNFKGAQRVSVNATAGVDNGQTLRNSRRASMSMGADTNEFINMAAASGAKFPELVAAQMILESAGGTALSGTNNFFGIKATAAESSTAKQTTEFRNGVEGIETANFKNYSSPQESVNDLVSKWYKDYPGYQGVNNANSLEEAAMMLQQQGYATDPKYAQKLIQIANRFR